MGSTTLGSASGSDLVVVGGGPAGAFAALTARRIGLRTTIVDDGAMRPPTRPYVGEVLPPAARRLIEATGLLRAIEPRSYLESCGTRSAWGSPSLASTNFISNPLGSGLHLDRAAFDSALMHAVALEGANVCAARVIDASRQNDCWQLTVEGTRGRQALCAATVIDCSGRRAVIARSQGARRKVDAPLVALMAWLDTRHDTDRDATLTLESASDGWWYTARLPGRHRVVGYITRRSSPDLRRGHTADGWHTLVNRTVHVRELCLADGYTLSHPPVVISAASSCLDRIVGERWAAAGDAAASFDPLSAQGILTAMLSGTHAARAMASRLSGDGGVALARYARQCHGVYAEHVRACSAYYAMESRWGTTSFWSRQSAAQGHLASTVP